jgi:hypothetical protein
MQSPYDHLKLTHWPFSVVPNRSLATFIADRQQLRSDVAGLLSALSRQDSSDIHLFWSWLGAGKTHTLYYLAHEAEKLTNDNCPIRLYPVYSEFPKSTRSFLDLYQSIMTEFDVDILSNAYMEISTAPGIDQFRRHLTMSSPDLVKALHVLLTGIDQDQVIAMRWLRAEALPITEFRRIGVSTKIGSSEEAVRIWARLVEILRLAAHTQGFAGCRVIWLLDEFQRIEGLSPTARREVNTGIHTTFNACPSALSIVLSFTGKPQVNSLPTWLSPELRDRIGLTKVMLLPPMLPEDALLFVKDVLAHFRIPEQVNLQPYYPFTEVTCKAIIIDIAEKGELKPRAIMSAFDAVLKEANPNIKAGKIAEISVQYAKSVLAQYAMLADQNGDKD